ncbi:MAG: ISL3 family transposase [Betaproteobacteria bacterium]|nr:ISL3 family transposase [Betaproteobacteria bacterium]
MGAVIPAKILGLEGQVIKDVVFNEESGRVRIICNRDRRRRPVDHRMGRRGHVNRLLRRTVLDVPIGGWPCEVEIEYAETFVCHGHVRVEALPFVAPKARVTRRYAKLIAGMARHMPISAVARHTGLSWDSVKAIECAHLAETTPMPRPATLTGIRYLGVDEVARAKGQSYFTLVYDLSPGPNYGRILWVKEGRESAVLLEFLDALSQECADGIAAVALDMGPAYIAAVKESLPNVAIVFDRFHVMQMFNKVIRDCRRAEFKAARTLGDLEGQQVIKGSLWLLLSNRRTLKETDQDRLSQLLAQNQPLASLYTLKEQLQRLWHQPASAADMAARLDDWCGMARAAKITGLHKFVKTLQSHRSGICAYADHPITTARLEAGNVSIALLRRRARGFRDMEYLKLKILQLNTEDTPSFLFNRMPTASHSAGISTVGNP